MGSEAGGLSGAAEGGAAAEAPSVVDITVAAPAAAECSEYKVHPKRLIFDTRPDESAEGGPVDVFAARD